jgi:hypothetical protein
VPVEEVPPTTEDGLRAIELIPFATTLSAAVLFVPYIAEIIAVAELETGLVVIVNVVVVELAGTVTVPGT